VIATLPLRAPPAHPIVAGAALDAATFAGIRRAMELSHFKWDAQIGDETTLAPFPLLVAPATWDELAAAAESLARETVAVEQELLSRPELHGVIALPRPLRALLGRGAEPTPAAARILRFDFHWTTDGWRVSEVNSDVPGGFTEAGNFTRLVAAEVPGARSAGDPTAAIIDALAGASSEHGAVALLSATGYLEDHQIIAHLAHHLRDRGLTAHLISPHHLRFRDGRAHLETSWHAGPVDAIVRFYQAEWLAHLPRDVAWQPLFVGGRTPVANPGVAALTESKRLPLVWDALTTPVPTWRRLSPEARAPGDAPWRTDDGWVLKQAYSNTGDTVSMRSEMTPRAFALFRWKVHFAPRQWVAQRRFEVVPVASPLGAVYPCLGVYTVNGVAAGVYGRISRRRIVDFKAIDVAVLVRRETP
jgi:glutathionylspermidine synthase